MYNILWCVCVFSKSKIINARIGILLLFLQKILTHKRFKRTLFMWTRHNLQIFGVIYICVVENSAIFVWLRTVLYYLCFWGQFCIICVAEVCAILFVWLRTVLCLCGWRQYYVCVAEDCDVFVWLRTVLCLCSWGLCCVCVVEDCDWRQYYVCVVDDSAMFVWLRTVLCLCGWGQCYVCVAEDSSMSV